MNLSRARHPDRCLAGPSRYHDKLTRTSAQDSTEHARDTKTTLERTVYMIFMSAFTCKIPSVFIARLLRILKASHGRVGFLRRVAASGPTRVSYLSFRVYEQRIVQEQLWTDLMVELHRLAIVHSEAILVENFYEAVFNGKTQPAIDKTTVPVLQDLFRLFTLTTLDSRATEFLLSGALSLDQLPRLTPAILLLLKRIRPHAVSLVDAWSIPDYLLDSALGRQDGDVYNALWKRAHLENPLNIDIFNPNFKTDEIVMGEGGEIARKRVEKLALGVHGHEQRDGGRSKL